MWPITVKLNTIFKVGIWSHPGTLESLEKELKTMKILHWRNFFFPWSLVLCLLQNYASMEVLLIIEVTLLWIRTSNLYRWNFLITKELVLSCNKLGYKIDIIVALIPKAKIHDHFKMIVLKAHSRVWGNFWTQKVL